MCSTEEVDDFVPGFTKHLFPVFSAKPGCTEAAVPGVHNRGSPTFELTDIIDPITDASVSVSL